MPGNECNMRLADLVLPLQQKSLDVSGGKAESKNRRGASTAKRHGNNGDNHLAVVSLGTDGSLDERRSYTHSIS